MRRHDADWASLVGGLVFLAIGGSAIVSLTTDVSVDPRWLLPVVLIGLGVAGLLSSLSRLGREAGTPRELPDPPRRSTQDTLDEIDRLGI